MGPSVTPDLVSERGLLMTILALLYCNGGTMDEGLARWLCRRCSRVPSLRRSGRVAMARWDPEGVGSLNRVTRLRDGSRLVAAHTVDTACVADEMWKHLKVVGVRTDANDDSTFGDMQHLVKTVFTKKQ